MKVKNKAVCMILALILVFCQADFVFAVTSGEETAADTQALLEGGEYKEDELLVVFDDKVSDKKIEKVVVANDAEAGEITEAAGDQKICQVTLDEDADIEEAIEGFSEEKTVEYVQPNYRYGFTGDDPYLDSKSQTYSYQLDAVNAKKAWDKFKDSKPETPITVAIIDTGVDINHEDLSQNMVKSTKGNYVSFRQGQTVWSMDDMGEHGTHCAGIVGAVYGNGKGTSGVASGYNNDLVKVLMVGNSPDGVYIYTTDILRAMNYIIDQKKTNSSIKVVSMSFSADVYDTLTAGIMTKAYEAGLTLVGASGNDNTDTLNYPAALPEVISVNASDKSGKSANFSNYGEGSDISAPGHIIYSTLPGDRYGQFSGTSMAAPCVAAVAALVLDANPNLTPAQVRNILCASTKEGQSSNSYFSRDGLAYGNVDAEAAVEAAKTFSASAGRKNVHIKCPDTDIEVGESTCIQAVVYPANLNKKVTFKSDNDNVTVDECGRITGMKAGKSNIKYVIDGVESSDSIEITVGGKAYTQDELELKVDWKPLVKTDGHYELAVGETAKISAKLVNKKTEDPVKDEVVFKSSNLKILSMDEGLMKAIKTGNVTVTVSDKTGNLSKQFSVEIKNGPEKISITSGPSYVRAGNKGTYKAVLTPVKKGTQIANKNSIVWSTSNKTKAVADNTGKVNFKKTGKVYVVAKYQTPNLKGNLDNAELMKTAKKQVVVYDKKYSGEAYKFKQVGKLKKKIKLSWKRMPNADGYYIYKAAKKNGKYKRVKTITKGSTTKVTLKTKKNGYYKIRAYYKLDSGKKLYANFKLSSRIYGKVKR